MEGREEMTLHTWPLWKDGVCLPEQQASQGGRQKGQQLRHRSLWRTQLIISHLHRDMSGPRVDGGKSRCSRAFSPISIALSTQGGRRWLMKTIWEPLVLCNHISLLHSLLEAPSVGMQKGLILGTSIYRWIKNSLKTFLCFAIWIHNTLTSPETFCF